MKSSLLLLFVLITLVSLGQEKWETTVKVGINYSIPNTGNASENYKWYPGLITGLNEIYNLSSIVALQSGIEYENLRTGFLYIQSNPGSTGPLQKGYYTVNYFTIPIHLNYNFYGNWIAFGGIAYRIGADGTPKPFTRGYNNDFALDAGVGYKINKISFNLLYRHGLSEIIPSSPVSSAKNRTISFYVSLPIWRN